MYIMYVCISGFYMRYQIFIIHFCSLCACKMEFKHMVGWFVFHMNIHASSDIYVSAIWANDIIDELFLLLSSFAPRLSHPTVRLIFAPHLMIAKQYLMNPAVVVAKRVVCK